MASSELDVRLISALPGSPPDGSAALLLTTLFTFRRHQS